MGLRFRKSFKIAPGVKFNLNKKSFGMTFGTKGAHYTINSKGTRTKSVGIPGTGLSYVDVENPERRSSTPQGDGQGPTGTGTGNGKRRGFGCLGLVLLVFFISAIGSLFSGHFNVFFGSLLVISVLLAITSLFNPKFAFWTKKKTKSRAFLGYTVLSLVLFLAVGATSPASQPSTSSTDSQTAATSDSSSNSDSSSSQADSSVWSDASGSSDASSNDSTANSSASSSSSPASQPAAAVTPPSSSSSSTSAQSQPASPTPQPASSAPAPPPAPSLQITGGGLSVSPGDYASVSVKTAPGASGTIEVVYKSGPSKAQGLGPQTADANGNITWTWKVGTNTTPGDYPVYITIGGKQTTATLHVN